jgi:hypothetical protein
MDDGGGGGGEEEKKEVGWTKRDGSGGLGVGGLVVRVFDGEREVRRRRGRGWCSWERVSLA